MTDALKYHIGQFVFSAIDGESRGLITGITFRPHGHVYLVVWGAESAEREHYEFELQEEKTIGGISDGEPAENK